MASFLQGECERTIGDMAVYQCHQIKLLYKPNESLFFEL